MTSVMVRAYQYSTLTEYAPEYGEPQTLPVKYYRIIRLVDFPQDYISGKLSSYYSSFTDYDTDSSDTSFGNRKGMEIVYDLDRHTFCEIDLSLIVPDSLREYEVQLRLDPVTIQMIETDT